MRIFAWTALGVSMPCHAVMFYLNTTAGTDELARWNAGFLVAGLVGVAILLATRE